MWAPFKLFSIDEENFIDALVIRKIKKVSNWLKQLSIQFKGITICYIPIA